MPLFKQNLKRLFSIKFALLLKEMLVVIHDAESDQLSVYIVHVWQNIFPKTVVKVSRKLCLQSNVVHVILEHRL